MRSFILSILFVAVAGFTYAQEITELEEAKVGFSPLDAKITQQGDSYSFTVNEAYTGEFAENPIAFLKANFDIQNFITETEDENFDSYEVNIRSSNGHLKADYDKHGELVSTFQKFKNIVLPPEVRNELYMTYKGWNMTENKYLAASDGDILNMEVYKIRLEKGNQKQNIKLDALQTSRSGVASN
ncbi:hypothetical protein [Christiangramia salexigens]|uniref:Nicotinate-nucleotide adenylyltransferase n=1 Tax=Christiangramia salexigens TaxID=1913577 RepID=A0A1L3J1Q6_9FLAO|nr:hypothetical protein [Christiangramia salexigens]APG59048.1 hypothetical protein LPB144_00895 [Christiangramia salexigens]